MQIIGPWIELEKDECNCFENSKSKFVILYYDYLQLRKMKIQNVSN